MQTPLNCINWNGIPKMRRSPTGERLAALCALGWLLFNFPLLSLFNDAGTWFGIPRLYAYLFIAWAVFIALLAVTVEKRSSGSPSSARDAADKSAEN